MARLLSVGFESRSWYELPECAQVGTTALYAGARYTGTAYSAQITPSATAKISSHLAQVLNGPTPEWYYRAGHKHTADPGATNGARIVFRNAADQILLVIRWDNASPIAGYSAANGQEHSGGTLLAQSAANKVFPVTDWALIRLHFKGDAVNGVFQLWLNHQLIIDFAGNTNPNGFTELNLDELDWMFNGATGTLLIDDLALNDTTGAVDNGLPDDGSVRSLVPNAAGDVTGMTPSTGANYTCVDDVPPNTTDYVQSNVAGTKDLYNLTTVTQAAGETIKGVMAWGAFLQVTQGNQIQGKVGIKTGGAEQWGAAKDLTYNAWKAVLKSFGSLNPTTGLAWTQADIDALQVGVQRV